MELALWLSVATPGKTRREREREREKKVNCIKVLITTVKYC